MCGERRQQQHLDGDWHYVQQCAASWQRLWLIGHDQRRYLDQHGCDRLHYRERYLQPGPHHLRQHGSQPGQSRIRCKCPSADYRDFAINQKDPKKSPRNLRGDFLGENFCAVGGMGYIDFRMQPRLGFITVGKSFRKPLSLFACYQIYRTAPKTRASQARAVTPLQRLSNADHAIQFGTGDFVQIAQTGMALVH